MAILQIYPIERLGGPTPRYLISCPATQCQESWNYGRSSIGHMSSVIYHADRISAILFEVTHRRNKLDPAPKIAIWNFLITNCSYSGWSLNIDFCWLLYPASVMKFEFRQSESKRKLNGVIGRLDALFTNGEDMGIVSGTMKSLAYIVYPQCPSHSR